MSFIFFLIAILILTFVLSKVIDEVAVGSKGDKNKEEIKLTKRQRFF